MKRFVLWLPLVCCCTALCASAQSNAGASAPAEERKAATALFDQGKHKEALVLFEKLAVAYPGDAYIQDHMGFALYSLSASLPDAEARRKQRIRPREYFLKAAALGSTNPQARAILSAIPEDGGGDVQYSRNADVDQTMQQAEAAFSTGDARKALTLYQQALALDPSLYEAALYSGDAFMRLDKTDSAYRWYEHATKINPNKETAWRYWSDVLLKNNHPDEALDKAIEAVVADPYARLSRQGILAWSRKVGKTVRLPAVNLPETDTSSVLPRYRVAYDSVRAAWKGTGSSLSAVFAKEFPAERSYRHSVAEERAALRAAYKAGGDDPGVAYLKKMDDAGLLEAYIFHVRPDDGIASEYAAYSRDFRDVLKRFWTEMVIAPAIIPKSPDAAFAR